MSGRPPESPPDRDPGDGPEAQPGWVAPEVAAEFPQLALVQCDLPLPANRRSPRGVREQLAMLSNRHRGATALALRREPVAGAYRVFFRHIGLDPDVTRTPVEAAVLERLLRGGFASRDLLSDALLLALVQTSVPVWALDAGRCEGRLGVRPAASGERLGRGPAAPPLAAGRLVVADETSAPRRAVRRDRGRSRREPGHRGGDAVLRARGRRPRDPRRRSAVDRRVHRHRG